MGFKFEGIVLKNEPFLASSDQKMTGHDGRLHSLE